MLLNLLAYDVRIARLAVFTVFFFTSSVADSRQEWTCKKMKLVRKITVEAAADGKSPCRIVYSKPIEKVEPREIGAAKHSFSFCEKKAEEMALKLQNLDWECEREDS